MYKHISVFRPVWGIIIVNCILFLCFTVLFYWTMRILPEDGVKLRGTVETGVDLLGSRNELWWILGFGAAIFSGNTFLAFIVRRFEHVASLYLLCAIPPVLLIASAALVVILALNPGYS